MTKQPKGHIRLTSHPPGGRPTHPLQWGQDSARARGPVIGSTTARDHRNVIGAHGGAYSVYRALAVSSGTLDPDALPDLKDTGPMIEIGPHPQWGRDGAIVSLDPWGHRIAQDFADEIAAGLDIRPTIAITKARLMLPEVNAAIERGRLREDGVVVHAGGEVSVTKAAIDPVWYLPGVAARFGVSEASLRRTLFEQTAGMYPELVTRGDLHVFLPPIGGTTLYIFGDASAIDDPLRPLTCRIHDECNGSDVFGSDICTCRPYLTHGVEECIRAAQTGGSGLIVYNRKEGRALGEVTKFLVYNARKRQPGGDQAATYFARTECVAGVQDARFQQLMPDVLQWLGIERIDRLVSMSNLKYDALIGAGIAIGERVPLPEELVPPDALVEIEAKKAAGYFVSETDLGTAVDAVPSVVDVTSKITDMRSALLGAGAVRAAANRMFELACAGRLEGWRVDLGRLDGTAEFVAGIVRQRYPSLAVPVHARWRHFVFGGRDAWADIAARAAFANRAAAARAAFDLVVVSVLLDAGAGAEWRYSDAATGLCATRSEGLALASVRWFESGGLSDDPGDPLRVDAAALCRVNADLLGTVFQASETNPLTGLSGRAALLNRLGSALQARPELFARADAPRPGGLFDAIVADGAQDVSAAAILELLLDAFGPIWQDRPVLDGASLGDCWHHPALGDIHSPDGFAPLHKLTQWLTYSLLEPLQWAGVSVGGVHELTGLAEYRNGGLFVDTGVLNVADGAALSSVYTVGDPFIVGWRSLTVALLDRLAPLVGGKLGLSATQFPLASALEGGTWAAGRQAARRMRAGGGPPFNVLSDGTVF